MCAAIIPNIGSSFTFTCTNGNKVANGDYMRLGVAGAQAYKTAQGLADLGLYNAQKVVDGINTAATKPNTCKGLLAKGVLVSADFINPLITLCVATKIATADDKEKALCTDGMGLLGMFAAEGAFKKTAKTELAQKCLANISKVGGKHGKIFTILTEGGMFAATSIAGFSTASKIGGNCLEAERSAKKEKLEKQEGETDNPINPKAELEYLA